MTCCGRANRVVREDFCSSLRITTGATLSEFHQSWTLRVMSNGRETDLAEALAPCPQGTAGVKLAQATLVALRKAVSQGKQAELQRKAGRKMPLVLLKDFLFKLVGSCSSCNGRGCSACNGMGV